MANPAYRPRKPKASPLWQCLVRHFDVFLGQYEECYRKRYGFLRPISILDGLSFQSAKIIFRNDRAPLTRGRWPVRFSS